MRHITLIIVVLALAIASPAIAGKGGNGGGNGAGGGGNNVTAAGSCTVSGNVVTGTGLPTDQALNFMVTNSTGTMGWVLGYTATGTWTVGVPAASGATTYEFAGRTYGADGSKYTVYASCGT